MYSDYRLQIDQILEDTEKEEVNNSQDKIAAVAMYKIMVGAIGKFIEKESFSDPEFDAALSLDWKNAGRMLKYIWSKAEKMALRHGQTASCCLTEEAVYAWVREYYFLDDREMVMEERAKKAEAGRKRSKRQIIGVYKRSAAYDIVQLEHLDNQIVAKVPSYLRFLFLLRLRYRALARKQLLPGSMLIMQLDHCPLAFLRSGLFSGVSLDALALETAVHTMTDAAAVSSLHMSCRLLTRAPYQP